MIPTAQEEEEDQGTLGVFAQTGWPLFFFVAELW